MSPRTLKILCTVSILLNIFLLAGVAASLVWLRIQRPVIGAGAMRIAGSELSAEDRLAFRQALRHARREARPLVVADRQARRDAAALLRAPVVDQPALAKALAAVRDADFAVRAHVEGGVVAFVATLPQEDRARLAEALERRGGPRRR